jgi:hypothetical protein
MLSTANLDVRVVFGRDAAPVLRLLQPQQQRWLKGMVMHGNFYNDPINFLTRFTADAVPVGKVIKVSGGMWLVAGRQSLDVHYRYLFVYAVRQRGVRAGWPLLVTARREGYFSFHRRAPGSALQRLWWTDGESTIPGALCIINDHGLIHPAWKATVAEPTPSAVPVHVNLYDLTKPLPAKYGCLVG